MEGETPCRTAFHTLGVPGVVRSDAGDFPHHLTGGRHGVGFGWTGIDSNSWTLCLGVLPGDFGEKGDARAFRKKAAVNDLQGRAFTSSKT